MRKKRTIRPRSVTHPRLRQQLKAAEKIAASRLPAEIYTMPSELIAERCGVSVALADRWKLGTSRMPYAWALVLSGDLSVLGKDWQGWRMKNGALITPDGLAVTPAMLNETQEEAKRQGCSISELIDRWRRELLK
jgi:hypothetical protein